MNANPDMFFFLLKLYRDDFFCFFGLNGILFLGMEEDDNSFRVTRKIFSWDMTANELDKTVDLKSELLAKMHDKSIQNRDYDAKYESSPEMIRYAKAARSLFGNLCLKSLGESSFRLHEKTFSICLLRCLRDVYHWDSFAGVPGIEVDKPCLTIYTIEGFLRANIDARNRKLANVDLLDDTFCFLRDAFFPDLFEIK
jgi:hypothetical protein